MMPGAQVTDWLAATHPVPRQAHAEWANHGVALLPLGVRFDAIRVPGQLLHDALGSADPQTVAAALDGWLHGPVIRDSRTGSGQYYVLVAPDAEWQGDAVRLSSGTYLAVPRVGEQVSPVTRWTVPPQRYGQLCDPAHLAALLATAEPLKAIES
ncbi:hypothetical protein GPA10_25100 [Streptomyces sp. p1417]|uniref:Bifunctional DNA primase/polymerase, N-terminal n=1 Tax=Streptomyces typhae TaxID=2681492 RepID=A0A6L6X2K6_9ACTN|nr:hypothetical protein [Streptomyces typhae]MVO87946.1 hypothetical protein [Streptomyces typhae]